LLVEFVSPSNASIFNDYVLPNIKSLATDPEPSVRIAFAQCIVPLAEVGARFISMAGWLRVYDKAKKDDLDENDEGTYDAKMSELHEAIIELVVQLLLADPVSSVRRALVHNIAPLCIFLGRDTAADVLLSHMVTFLNDRDWLLRAAFFESAVDIASCVGGQCVDDYIVPLMLQALSGKARGSTQHIRSLVQTRKKV
jgi:phosphoinositide-3-kinase regulatory subunit 4